MEKLDRLERINCRLLEIQNKFDKEPYKKELIELRSEINQLGGKDVIQIGYENNKTIDNNIKVSLEMNSYLMGVAAVGIGVLIGKILHMVFGRSSGGSGGGSGGGGGKSDFKITVGGEDYNKVVKRAKAENKRMWAKDKEARNFLHPNEESKFRNKKDYNLSTGHYKYEFGVAKTNRDLLHNNPKNKMLDVFADKVMEDLRKYLGHYVLAVGGRKFSVEILEKALKEVNKIDVFEYYEPLFQFANLNVLLKGHFKTAPLLRGLDKSRLDRYGFKWSDSDREFKMPAFLYSKGQVFAYMVHSEPNFLQGNDGIHKISLRSFTVNFTDKVEDLEIVDNTISYDSLSKIYGLVSKNKGGLNNKTIKEKVLGLRDLLLDHPDLSKLQGNYSDKAKEKLRLTLAKTSDFLSDLGSEIYNEYKHELTIITNLGKGAIQFEEETRQKQDNAQINGRTTWKD